MVRRPRLLAIEALLLLLLAAAAAAGWAEGACSRGRAAQ